MVSSIDSGATAYTYDASNQRVRKTTGSNFTEYVYFGGNVIGEKDQTGAWSDYIFANGKRIAKADDFKDLIHLIVTNASTNGQYVSVEPIVSSWPDLVIHSGDKLYFRQYQGGNGNGGAQMAFTDGSWVAGSTGFNDSNGQPVDHDTTQGWHNRVVDLSSYAGKTLSRFILLEFSGGTGSSGWDAWFRQIAIVGTDGGVRTVYNGQASLPWNGPNATALSSAASLVHDTNVAAYVDDTTVYYNGDHLGSSRLMTSTAGWPVWQGTYLPFGWEYNATATTNHYKFTAKERDAESGLDYMDARYYGSNMGRFMSPDPVFATVNRLYDPQQWNMYSYGRNNPLSNSDPTGLDFNITGCGDNSATCQNNQFGTTSTDANGKSSFTATVISNGANGGLVDQNGNSYNGTFDQSGFHFSNSDGSVSGGGQFIHDSAETDLSGSGVFSGTEGRFNSDCGGSCQGKGSISDIVAGSGAVQSAKDAFGLSKEDAFNIFGGHGKAENYRGPGEQDAHIVQHLAGRDNGKTELHFEGHPPGRDLTNFVLHQVDAIHDLATHQSAKEPALP